MFFILWIIIPLILIGIFAFLEEIVHIRGIEEEALPYRKKDFLLNVAERKFFEEVQKIIPENFVVFPQKGIECV